VIESLRKEVEHLARLKQTASEKDRKLTEIRLSKQTEQETLLKEKQSRQMLLNKLTGRIKSQRREIDALRQDEKRLSDLVTRLARMARQRNDKTRKIAVNKNSQARPSEPVGINTELPDAAIGNLSFTRLKGLLRLPVKGELMNRFGAPRDDGGMSWKGLFIRALEGAEVRAIASGRVVFAEWLRGFGNLLIVDHGEGYMSLYSNNESLYKQPGESVKAGDTIATAGNSGGQEESGVYFELRHQGRPINPMAWIK
jgi:septal ring factor EnvC (AmiA/AmiB activator)